MPMRLTLTGADERTPVSDLVLLAHRSPHVEIGLLYSASTKAARGRNRYPKRDTVLALARMLSGRAALHVCGSEAKAELLDGRLIDITRHTPRVQLNGDPTAEEVVSARRHVQHLITQHTPRTADLLVVPCDEHSVLVDGSGGRGLLPQFWVNPPLNVLRKPVGFAGGLGPDNLMGQMEVILDILNANEREVTWFDMESKLRDEHDWFDMTRARACVAQFLKVEERMRMERVERRVLRREAAAG